MIDVKLLNEFLTFKTNIMRLIKKYFAFTLVFAFTSIIFNSCKKINQNPEINLTESVNLDKAKQNVRDQMNALGGMVQRVEVNQRMQMAYADMNGNIINSLSPSLFNNLTSTCAGDLPDYLDLSYYYRLYTCGQGYNLTFGWYISWNNNVVLQNPNNSSNRTRGTIRVYNNNNAIVYNNTTFNVQIADQGVDPNNPANNIFFVEMTSSTLIPESVVNASGATLRLGAFFASDCSTLDNYSIVPMSVTGFGFTTPLNSDPCTRNDKTYFSSPGSVGYRRIGISGYDVLGICPSYSASADPSVQEVQYSFDNGTTWNDFLNFTSPFTSTSSPTGAILGARYVTRIDFARSPTLAVGSYNVKVRYRNIKYNSGVSGYPLPTTTNSCANSTWTIDSFQFVVN